MAISATLYNKGLSKNSLIHPTARVLSAVFRTEICPSLAFAKLSLHTHRFTWIANLGLPKRGLRRFPQYKQAK